MDGKYANKKLLNIIREIPTKTTEKLLNTYWNDSDFKKKKNWQYQIVKGYRATQTLSYIHCWWECKMVSHFGKVWQLLIKLNICLRYDPAILPQGIYPREMKTSDHTNLYTNTYCSFICNSQKLETTQHLSTGKWKNKLWT